MKKIIAMRNPQYGYSAGGPGVDDREMMTTPGPIVKLLIWVYKKSFKIISVIAIWVFTKLAVKSIKYFLVVKWIRKHPYVLDRPVNAVKGVFLSPLKISSALKKELKAIPPKSTEELNKNTFRHAMNRLDKSIKNQRPYHGGCLKCAYNRNSNDPDARCISCQYKDADWGLPDLRLDPIEYLWKRDVQHVDIGKIPKKQAANLLKNFVSVRYRNPQESPDYYDEKTNIFYQGDGQIIRAVDSSDHNQDAVKYIDGKLHTLLWNQIDGKAVPLGYVQNDTRKHPKKRGTDDTGPH